MCVRACVCWAICAVLPLGLFRNSAKVYENTVEDNARAGIFFHRSCNYAEAYDNTCRRNLEGDFGIVESTGVLIHDNIMEVTKVPLCLWRDRVAWRSER